MTLQLEEGKGFECMKGEREEGGQGSMEGGTRRDRVRASESDLHSAKNGFAEERKEARRNGTDTESRGQSRGRMTVV